MSSPPIKEISAFHPGERVGIPSAGAAPTQVPYANPMEGWSDAQYHKPDAGKLVTGWTGRFMCQCVYDHARKMWVTNKGTPIKVLMWDRK